MNKIKITESQYDKLMILKEAFPNSLTPSGTDNSQVRAPQASSQPAQANNLTISNDVRKLYSLFKKQGATVKLFSQQGYVVQSRDFQNPEHVFISYGNNVFNVYIKYDQIGKEKATSFIDLITKTFPNYQLTKQPDDNGSQILAQFAPKTNRNGGSVVTENMKKIKITEEQYSKLLSLDEAWIDNDPKEDEKEEKEEKSDDSKETDKEEKENLYENVEKTFGNLEVRNLIKEGEEIHGEVKSSYGVWKTMKWDNEGTAKGFDNVFKRLTYKLDL